jgi:N-acetyl-gamma-glutamyl-phosphate/LysW-gamma-L-alpha-aminoadipyl-6-phosphate reductase
MSKTRVSIAGASGYTGGELIRLLIHHPHAEIKQITSESLVGKYIFKAHPNLRTLTQLKFHSLSELEECDALFLCLPHGESMNGIDSFRKKAEKIIDLSADFRLNDADTYERWYGKTHACPGLLKDFVYGIPELHREEMRNSRYISSAGCNATATILALYPFYKNKLVAPDRTVVEVKVGSSEGGNKASDASHHPERSGCVRSFMPTQHRHTAEMLQELAFDDDVKIHFSATSIDMVRGVLATAHIFLKEDLQEKDVWKLYRREYGGEPFIRIVKDNEGYYRLPEPKLLSGTNFCDIGFQKDALSKRFVIISAIDNLMKGAAGQAVQAFNIMYHFDETTGLQFPGLHPI